VRGEGVGGRLGFEKTYIKAIWRAESFERTEQRQRAQVV